MKSQIVDHRRSHRLHGGVQPRDRQLVRGHRPPLAHLLRRPRQGHQRELLPHRRRREDQRKFKWIWERLNGSVLGSNANLALGTVEIKQKKCTIESTNMSVRIHSSDLTFPFIQTQTSIFELSGNLWTEREEFLPNPRKNAVVVSVDNSQLNC